MEPFVAAAFLAVVSERIIEAFVSPLFKKINIDTFFLLYIGLILGGVVGWLSGINCFGEFLPDPLVGRILTSIVVGGGSNLVHTIFSNKPKTEVYFDSGNNPLEYDDDPDVM